MGHQKAGEKGKPGIHIGNQDAKRANRLNVGDKSPSTVYSNSLEAREKFEKLQEEKRKELESKVVSIKQEAKEWDIDPQLIGVTIQ